MAFKKTKDGWVSDPKGKGRIPTKKNLFENIPPVTVYDGETGYPLLPNGKIDWSKVIDEKNQEE